MNSFSSRVAPTKFASQLLQINEGFPRRAIKRCRAAIKVSLGRSEAKSICTALTDSDTNTQTYQAEIMYYVTYTVTNKS